MTFEAINTDRLISMASLAETVVTSDYTVVHGTCMTLYAILQADFVDAYAFAYCFVALMNQQMHVVYTHPLRVSHTLTAFDTLADIQLRAKGIRCEGGHCGKYCYE